MSHQPYTTKNPHKMFSIKHILDFSPQKKKKHILDLSSSHSIMMRQLKTHVLKVISHMTFLISQVTLFI